MIPYGKHLVDEDDIDAVVDVLRNQFLTQGTVVPQFENALCGYTGANYCVAVNSATSGLHVACIKAQRQTCFERPSDAKSMQTAARASKLQQSCTP